jgi:hypothetical protein
VNNGENPMNRTAALKASLHLAAVVVEVAALFGLLLLAKSSPLLVAGLGIVVFVAIVWWLLYELAIHSSECREEIDRLSRLK